MSRLFIKMLLVSMILLLGFQAWGEPAPTSLAGPEKDFQQFTIRGNLLGVTPRIGQTGELVSSTEGLKDCVMLADLPVLEKSRYLEVLSINQCDSTSLTFVSGEKVPDEFEQMFLFIIDGEGNQSLPVGPLKVVDGLPHFYPRTIDLTEAPFEISEGDTVQVLQADLNTSAENEESDTTHSPGQPGKPTIN